jgi:hypothetical protein
VQSAAASSGGICGSTHYPRADVLVEAIIADRLSPHDAPITSDEEDLGCALQMVQWVRNQANARDVAEGLAEWQAAAIPKDA